MSLYRAYPSKDALVEAILREDCAEHACGYGGAVLDPALPRRERPRAYVMMAVEALRMPGFRGCPLAMAIVEFPDADHPVRQVADAEKRAVRERLHRLCAEAGAPAPEALGDALLLLVEGAFAAAPYLGNAEAARLLEAAADTLLRAGLPAE
jgi:AcrR family transcriptional regulator